MSDKAAQIAGNPIVFQELVQGNIKSYTKAPGAGGFSLQVATNEESAPMP